MSGANGDGISWPGLLLGGVAGYAAANGGLGGNNRKDGDTATPGVTQDQLSTQLAALQGQLQRDQLSSQIAGLETGVAGIKAGVDSSVAGAVSALGGAIGGVKDAVVAGNQQTAMSLCNLGHTMQQGFGTLNNTVVAENAATRSRIDQLEIGDLRDKIAERDLAIAKMGNDAGHRDTQVLIQNTANANAVAQAQSSACCNPCGNSGSNSQATAIAELRATVAQLTNAIFAIHGDVAKIRGTVAP